MRWHTAPVRLPGYLLGTEIHCGEHHLLRRGRREADGTPVLLRRASPSDDPHRELALRADLGVAGVPRALDVVRDDGGRSWLVTEDRGGVPLDAGPVELGTFFHLAVQLAAILGELHRRDVIHKNVQPASILVHPTTRELWLDGFGLATRGSGETQPPLVFRALPYSSPEQTGRMNRTVDYRTDFYSLGVVLYELLTGQRPFAQTDPLELIHAHIAMTPPSPSELAP